MTYEGDGVPVGLPNVGEWVDPSTRPPAALVRMTPGGDGVPIRGTMVILSLPALTVNGGK